MNIIYLIIYTFIYIGSVKIYMCVFMCFSLSPTTNPLRNYRSNEMKCYVLISLYLIMYIYIYIWWNISLSKDTSHNMNQYLPLDIAYDKKNRKVYWGRHMPKQCLYLHRHLNTQAVQHVINMIIGKIMRSLQKCKEIKHGILKISSSLVNHLCDWKNGNLFVRVL